MTTSLPEEDTPWIPGAPRSQSTRLLPLPPGAASNLRAYITAVDDAAGVSAETRTDDQDGTLRLRLRGPSTATAVLLLPAADPVALWLPHSSSDRSSLPPSWVDDTSVTPFTGPAIGSLLGRGDRALVTFGATTASGSLRMRAGMVEETADLLLSFEADLTEGPMEIVLKLNGDRFETAVATVGRALGMTRPPVSPSEYAPVLCTWYSFHQALDPDRLLEEAAAAAKLGFGNLIVDDGWQTEDCDRGYGSCGDWNIHPAKIGDASALVEKISRLGLRTLWWIGTPFLGHRSKAYTDDLPTLYDEPDMEAAVLDPRSRRARSHLISRLDHLVGSTGAAGLKIDFLERWAAETTTAPPADAVEPSVTQAALSLLDEIHDALTAHVAQPSLEFRAPYISGDTVRRATMLRVADCPLSPVVNRTGVIDLRLMTDGIAVHSDPIMWGEADSPERVAQHLHSSLFGVPQVSVALTGQSERQLATLRTWMQLWTEYSDVLLHGSLRVTGIAGNYTVAEASLNGATVTAQYAPAFCDIPHEASEWILVNAHDGEVAVRTARTRTAVYRISDCEGNVVDEGTVTFEGLSVLGIPPGGFARLSLLA
ncbi:alpha-galactosidase [Streptomyces sp. NBC_00829]|uniref:alpha-galactosidase n=1 Tax=Streptomyces sp. NBC_00829 TaxID=2903679 RepID=UPI00386E2910|nr:alpha-galactosidase [Streptomyces sp. NBC_00829]